MAQCFLAEGPGERQIGPAAYLAARRLASSVLALAATAIHGQALPRARCQVRRAAAHAAAELGLGTVACGQAGGQREAGRRGGQVWRRVRTQAQRQLPTRASAALASAWSGLISSALR